jgi:ABC-type glycerol-3-phosphate transport system substrate-binding protein
MDGAGVSTGQGVVSRGLSRRNVLLGALGLGVAACSRVGRAAARHPGSGAASVSWEAARPEYYASVPGLSATFDALRVGVAVGPDGSTSAGYALAFVPPVGQGLVPGAVPLDETLRHEDFDIRLVPPGALAMYQWKGSLVGLPVTQWPIAVRWREDVFRAAGVAAPAPSWRLPDLTDACDAITHAMSRGTVRGLDAVMFPPAGLITGSGPVPGAFGQPGWWTAFALGYGGTVVAGGVFAVDAKALSGLEALVTLARAYGNPPSPTVRPTGHLPSVMQRYALVLDYWSAPGGARFVPSLEATYPQLRFGPEWRWARAPVFPAAPVVTTWVGGEGVVDAKAAQRGAASAPRGPAEAVAWLTTAGARSSLTAWGGPPVAGGPPAQAFWQTWDGGSGVGDWPNFEPYASGWPGPVGTAPMGRALQAALTAPGGLESGVAAAVQTMNSQLQMAKG